MSKPVVYGTALPIVVVDGSSTIVFAPTSIQANTLQAGVATTGLTADADISLAPYAQYAALSEPIAKLLAELDGRPARFAIDRTLCIGFDLATFTASNGNGDLVQRFAGFGNLASVDGESTLNGTILTSVVPLLPASLQKRAYTVKDELLLTY